MRNLSGDIAATDMMVQVVDGYQAMTAHGAAVGAFRSATETRGAHHGPLTERSRVQALLHPRRPLAR